MQAQENTMATLARLVAAGVATEITPAEADAFGCVEETALMLDDALAAADEAAQEANHG